MKALLRSELRKVRWTRSLWMLPLVGVALNVIAATVLITAFKAEEFASHLSEHGPLRFGATNVGLFVVLFGIRVFGDEVQHQTLTATLVRQPHRTRVFAAKAALAAGMALLMTAAIYALVVPITVLAAGARDLPMTFDVGTTVALFGRVCVAMVLSALLGVGLATLARNRTIALVAFLLWITLGETIIGGLLKIPRYMFGAAVQSVVSAGGSDVLPVASALALLLIVVGALTGGGLIALRRDID